MQCDARMRPFPNDTEVRCEKDSNHGGIEHSGVIKDYAYPGSETRLTWYESDRRTFYGEWPGYCEKLEGEQCILPAKHPGRCAV